MNGQRLVGMVGTWRSGNDILKLGWDYGRWYELRIAESCSDEWMSDVFSRRQQEWIEVDWYIRRW